MVGNGNSAEKPMTAQAVHFENFDVELSQPLKDRPDLILITTSDGRRCVLGDGQDDFTTNEYRQRSTTQGRSNERTGISG